MRVPFLPPWLVRLAAVSLMMSQAFAQSTTRVSVDLAGMQGNGYSFIASISSDGRYVAFQGIASNLVPGDTNGLEDIFVHDRRTGQTTRVSVDSAGVQGNSYSYNPSISSDGRYVAFESHASNLVPGDTNGLDDIFVHDCQTGQTTRVSVDSAGGQGNLGSNRCSISSDGRYVAFESFANNLVPGDTGWLSDVFVHDRQTGQTTRVSVDSAGMQGNSYSDNPSISSDGRYVAFDSSAGNLVPGDTNGTADVFDHDRQTGQTTRVSVDSAGGQGNNSSYFPSISSDGRYVAFTGFASNLVPGDTNGWHDVFIHDRQTGQTTRVSVDSAGVQGIDNSSSPSISSDGRYVAFESGSRNLVPGDTNGTADVFVHDRQGPSLTRTGSCPGPMTFTASGVTPGSQVVFVWGTAGSFTIPAGNPCVGTSLDLMPLLSPPPGYILVTASSTALATLAGTAPPGVCGVVVMQALDLTLCGKTNTMDL